MKKIFLLKCIFTAIITLPQTPTSSEAYKLENNIECLDTQAVKNYLETHTISDKRKALLLQHADDLVRLYRPTSLFKSSYDATRFFGGAWVTALSLMVLGVALDKNIIRLGKITEIKLGGLLSLLMIPICGVTGYVTGKLALQGWRLECAREKFNKAREIQYLLHGVRAE